LCWDANLPNPPLTHRSVHCAQGDWPKKPVVSSYDVVEKGGFVWLFYGSRGVPEDVRPPIPMMPEVRHRWQSHQGSS